MPSSRYCHSADDNKAAERKPYAEVELVGSILADHTNSSLENMDWVAEEEDIGHTDTEKTLLEKQIGRAHV